jgi:DNA-binding IclR family transcriptional regulator
VDARATSVHDVDTATNPVPGTQAVARAARLLRLVTAAGTDGATLQELAGSAGLSRPTTHRLLSALRVEGLVDRDGDSSRWMPGPELFLMGSVAAARYDVTALARDIVRSLAVKTEESAFFSVRRADETVCLLREEGSFPIRSFVLSEGVRFPLGVASAGLAILAFLPDHDVDAYLERHPVIVEGSWGLGAAVFDRAGRPEWALSLTGVAFRFSPERQAELGRILLAHAHQLSARIAHARR